MSDWVNVTDITRGMRGLPWGYKLMFKIDDTLYVTTRWDKKRNKVWAKLATPTKQEA